MPRMLPMAPPLPGGTVVSQATPVAEDPVAPPVPNSLDDPNWTPTSEDSDVEQF